MQTSGNLKSGNDYLKNARAAARNAAETSGSGKSKRAAQKEKAPKVSKVNKDSDRSKGDGGGSSKMPLIATASVVALATAGGTAYYVMKDNDTFDVQKIATPQTESASQSVETVVAATAALPSVSSATDLNAGMEEELFGDADPTESSVTEEVKQPPVEVTETASVVERSPPPPLPQQHRGNACSRKNREHTSC